MEHSQRHISRKAIPNELTMPLSTAASAQAGAAFNPPKCSKGPRDLELRTRYLENNLIKERLPDGGDDGDDCTLIVHCLYPQVHLCPWERGHCMSTYGTVHAPPSAVVKIRGANSVTELLSLAGVRLWEKRDWCAGTLPSMAI